MTRDLDALAAYLAGRGTAPFAWGRRANDCVAFGLGALWVQFGRDPLRETFGRATWSTPFGARRVLRRIGGLEAASDRALVPIKPAFAQRGDIAGVPDDMLGISWMVVDGTQLVGPGEHGLKALPLSAMVRAWTLTDG